MAKKTIHKAGKKPITFNEGGLTRVNGDSCGCGYPPPAKHRAAASGSLGKKAQKQEQFYENVLKKGGK